MDSSNRIQSTSITPTITRQTPKNEFGQVLANALGRAANVGGAFVGGMAGGTPVLSAAVSGLQAVVGATATGIVPVSSGPVVKGGFGAEAAVPQEQAGFELLRLQDQQSQHYLQLQVQMQQESREFNTVSNVLKVRHDSAKAAINNIR